jgi:two-component system, chemotaxis family, CheB/CheR fusion protein
MKLEQCHVHMVKAWAPVSQETAMSVVSGGKPKNTGVPGRSEGYPEGARSSGGKPELHRFFDDIVELVGSPAAVLDQSHGIRAANGRFCTLCTAARASLVGRHLRDVADGAFYAPAMQEALTALPSEGSEGSHRKRIDLVMTRGQAALSATVWRLPPACLPAAALLLVDLPVNHSMAPKSLRVLGQGASGGSFKALSVGTLRHDIRQPLQTLSLLQGVLAMREEDSDLQAHITRLREAIEALGGIMDVLEDLERPAAHPPVPRLVDFPIDSVLNRLRSEFAYHAEAKGLKLRVVSSRAVVHSDARSLEQLVRALLLAAIKMTSRGRVLLGCRRRHSRLRLEMWTGGEMIAPALQQEILDEFHRSAPLSSETEIVHSIVKPLSDMLGLSVKARSRPGVGLLFTADVPMGQTPRSELVQDVAILDGGLLQAGARGVVAAVSDNPSEYEALKLLLQEAGYQVVAVRHGAGRVEFEAVGGMQAEVIVADFALLTKDVVSLIGETRKMLGPLVPVVMILDGEWRTQSPSIADPVTYLDKPATAEEITDRVRQTLAAARIRLAVSRTKDQRAAQQTIFIVDDDRLLLGAMGALLRARGEDVEVHSNAEAFLQSYAPSRRGCLVVDDKLPGVRGVDLLERLNAEGAMLPSIVITGHGDIATAVRAMRAGAVDYIEKPVHHGQLLAAIDRALEIDRESADVVARRKELAARYATLTHRERQVMELVVKGASSKSIGRMLNISQRTVESHRAAVMKRMGATSLSELIRTVVEVGSPQEQ